MPSTRLRLFVFDFDGTLVDSAAAKRQAFFDLFPPAAAPAVAAVLAAEPDASRHVVIPMMLDEIRRRGLPPAAAADPTILAEAYGANVAAHVAQSPEMPGAGALLRDLSAVAPVYVASATPQAELEGHLAARGFSRHVSGAFGYPHRKVEVVAALLTRHATAPAALLVVGDGQSDEDAAMRNGCAFLRISRPGDLALVRDALEAANV